MLRDLGAAMSPFNAFQFIQGLETLPLRMREHCRNAEAVARLSCHAPEVGAGHLSPAVMRIPCRSAGPRPICKGGFGGLVGFELKGGREAGRRFIDALQMHYHVANIGDARSLAIHPATTTHSQLSPEEQNATGVSDGYVRLSVGIEHIDDILRRPGPGAEGIRQDALGRLTQLNRTGGGETAALLSNPRFQEAYRVHRSSPWPAGAARPWRQKASRC